MGTELVTNAIKHGAGDIELSITVRRYVLRLEVSDHSTVLPRAPKPSDTVGGHGLWLVAELASHWGARPTARGKTIWADLVLSHPPGNDQRPAAPRF
ncbi:MAG: ATP-binding protein [Pseudonocardiaceae bacterium]